MFIICGNMIFLYCFDEILETKSQAIVSGKKVGLQQYKGQSGLLGGRVCSTSNHTLWSNQISQIQLHMWQMQTV